MHKPLISIIIASYNQGQFLDECLKSVADQVYQDWECIIVDDASLDQSVSIAESWVKKDQRFKLIALPKNMGVSYVRNKGLKISKGDFFQFLDADDVLSSNKLNHHVSFIEGDLITVSGSRYFYNQEGKNHQRIIGKNGAFTEVVISRWDQTDVLEVFKERNPFVVSAPLFPRSVLTQVGYQNENLKAFEDWEFNFRCALKGYKFHHIGYAQDAQVLVRLHSSSMTTQREEMLQRRREFNYTIRSNKDYQAVFGYSPTLSDRPLYQKGKTLLRSLIPPLFLDFTRKFSGFLKRK
ncbi:glycosyltransferase family 2 protein [Algoriphagus marinus]|uniref:glycosyltransferase family 2 protein n=1 Tax=Algoriphagus marinus TaxID=1925762 RepID=UPI00094BA0D3|nr:glycosyltransferase [Algoriphagus marinus]